MPLPKPEEIEDLIEPNYITHHMQYLELCQHEEKFENVELPLLGCDFCGDYRGPGQGRYRPCIHFKPEYIRMYYGKKHAERYYGNKSVCLQYLIEQGSYCYYEEDNRTRDLRIIQYFAGLRCGYKMYLRNSDVEFIRKLNARQY